MSSVNSASTLVEVEAAYDDNASYAEDADVAKAKAFVTACRILLRRLPAEAGTRETHMKTSPEQLQKEIAEARAWIQANDTAASGASGPRVTLGSFQSYR